MNSINEPSPFDNTTTTYATGTNTFGKPQFSTQMEIKDIEVYRNGYEEGFSNGYNAGKKDTLDNCLKAIKELIFNGK